MNKLYDTKLLVRSLLDWYYQNKRDLPWRNNKDPYKIWLSEVMLQQTQVETVIPYYQRWINKYPTLMDAARASEHQLLKIWEGLGYYNRCRNFHKSVKIVRGDYGGHVPDELSEFKKLPGVGDYIASAVLSIVYGKQYPALDGNILRVLSRILRKKINSPYNRKTIHNHLDKWMKWGHSGDINEALMDLGSAICRPNQAHCHECPVSSYCGAVITGHPELYPTPPTKKKSPCHHVVTGVIWEKNKFLILLRENKKHLGGLWEFPGGKVETGESKIKALKREINEECGISVSVEEEIGSFKHVYTHFAIQMTSFHCRIKNGNQVKTNQAFRWIDLFQIKDYAFPRANHKIFSLMRKNNSHD